HFPIKHRTPVSGLTFCICLARESLRAKMYRYGKMWTTRKIILYFSLYYINFRATEKGAFKNVPQGCRRVWFINRFSQCENAIAQSELLQPLQQHDVEAIWLGDIQEHPAIARRFVN
ncbi:hypothetical protein OTG39_08190, partial [Escherichia coli]|nr:hypothetical protein [Escherichia coli]